MHLYLSYCLPNLVEILFVPQEGILWNPVCLPGRPLRHRESLLKEWMILSGLIAEQA